jgi:hypothetical protein
MSTDYHDDYIPHPGPPLASLMFGNVLYVGLLNWPGNGKVPG